MASVRQGIGAAMLAEMAEFATFPKGAQRYIGRSLDLASRRPGAAERWARSDEEADAIRLQARIYERLDRIRGLVPDDDDADAAAPLLAELIALSAYDLSQGWLTSFAAYRFLYERLLGAAARPFLPAAFCAAAALPYLHPQDRRELLPTIGGAAAAAGWSLREPLFVPGWVEKVDAEIAV